MNNKALITVSSANCRISRRSLLSIGHFEIGIGQHWCLFGGNGAGKSLLAQLIAGHRIESKQYVSYAAGFEPKEDIFIVSFEQQQLLWQRDNRLDISEYSASASDRGTLVSELITSARPLQSQDRDQLSRLVASLALHSVYDKGIRFLSSGQIRKALIARALYGASGIRPSLIILDDPLESIDRNSQQHISKTLQDWMVAGNSSLLLCRRKQDILPSISHLALMDKLTIVEQGTIGDIKRSQTYAQISTIAPPQLPNLPQTQDRQEQSSESGLISPIELIDVNASYGDQLVLSKVNWLMESHHHTLIQGPNGCGKSTLLSLIDGENHKAYGQQLKLFGKLKGSGESIWQHKSHFGVVSNELHNKYIKGWRVLDVIVSGFFDSVGLYDDSTGAQIDAALQWLKLLDIQLQRKAYYHEISFGQQRLVLLARAMVKQPRLLILDEPCVGLDDYHRSLILQVLDAIASQTTTQLIYVSHVEEEMPNCINQRLSFSSYPQGGHKIIVENL
ncbi:MAG: ABC transporter ATP-binding protein [SAR86 cluster bacterium]|uniref:ABC transporter ATP-binding protein n=1 Tax=SAR86 cluster bacterium TaxID=2030880 RepID=A0A2A4MMX4_9GAMM|nr:MAG: ABC transporter ATP-binding protein [SAR86 cluster bacterium]